MTVSVGLDGGHQPELEDETVVVGRQLPVQTVVEGVGGQLALQQGSCALVATGTLRAYQGKAHAATSRPAASAMTWLLADEPRLGKAARNS